MSDPSGRIAIDIIASANVAEIAKARSEVSALGVAATKAGGENVAAWQAAATSVNVQVGAYERLGKVIDKTNLQAVAGYRALGVSLKENLFQLEAQEVEINRVDAAMVRLERSAGAAMVAVGASETAGLVGSSYRAKSAFIGAAFALDAFSRSTDAGEGATRRLLRSVSLLGFAFGPEIGIITTTVTSLGDSIVEAMTRSATATEKARIEFEKLLESAGRSGLSQAASAAQLLYSGDPFARRGAIKGETEEQFRVRREGIRGLEQEMARLAAIQQGTTSEWEKAQIKIRELQPVLDEQNRRLKEALGVVKETTGAVTERARAELEQMRARAAERERQRLRPEEVPLGIGDLGAQEAAFGISGRNRLGNLGIRGFGEFTQDELSVSTKGIGRGIRPAAIIPSQFMQMNEAIIAESEKTKAILAQRMGTTLGDGLAAGIRAGFSGAGIKAAFAAGSKVILAGLGGMLIDEGRIYLEKSAIMTALVPHLFNPATAGWAAAGIGAALIGLGAALEGLASSGRNGGGGGYAAGGGTFTPNATPGGGMTVVVQVGDVTNRALVNSVTYEINRAGILNTPIVAPYGRPS